MTHQLTTCKKCESRLCYEQVIDESTTTWMCFNCGFTTNTALTKGSEALEHIKETAPELYKQLLWEDDEGRVWMPATISHPEKGIVYVDGTSIEDWRWVAAPAVLLTEEDRKLKNYPEGVTHRVDMKAGKSFDRLEFGQAMMHI